MTERVPERPRSAGYGSVDRRYAYGTAGAVLLYVLLAFGSVLTKRPWCDEAWFASPALDLIVNGRMGTHVLEPTGTHLSLLKSGARLDRIDQHTYWVMPLHFLVLALWFKVFGFSLTVLRLPAVVWGLAALGAWYAIVRRLGGSRELAALTLFFIGIDYAFVNSASDGRMDMMCASLGFLAMAVYLALREARFPWAVLLSHAAAALSVFTHPNGVLASVSLLFMMFYLDRKRFSLAVLPLAGMPYAIGALGWAAYIMQDRAAFVAQFGANASNRLSGLAAPVEGLRLEIARRYLDAHFLPLDAGLNGRLKFLILLGYVAALAVTVAVPALRRHPGYRLLLYLAGLRFLMMAWGVALKNAYYLVHIVPFYAFFMACAACWLWQRSNRVRSIAALLLCLVAGLQLSWSLYRTFWLRPYQKQYMPAVGFLKARITPQDLVCGSAELAFAFGFYNPQIVDDLWMGRWSGKRPTIIVVDKWYYGSVNASQKEAPGYYPYVTRLFHQDFTEIYSQGDEYRIYARKPGTLSP
jgi:hypothetical protein